MELDDMTLVALTPADMAPAQAALVAWCDRKLEALRVEQVDLETNLELATEHGWKYASVVATLNRTAKRVLYYEKIKAAVEAGYLVVPNFPIDVIAVRVNRERQPEKVRESRWGGFAAHPQLLPAGEGRYVDDLVRYRDETHGALAVSLRGRSARARGWGGVGAHEECRAQDARADRGARLMIRWHHRLPQHG